MPPELEEASNEPEQFTQVPRIDQLIHIEPDQPESQPVEQPEMPNITKEDDGTKMTEEPSLGGALNATVELAEDMAKNEQDDEQNKTILAHSYLGSTEPSIGSPINSSAQNDEDSNVDIFKNIPSPIVQPPMPDLPMPPEVPDFSSLPPQPQSQYSPDQQPYNSQFNDNSSNNDPSQFRIPGQ